MRAIFRADASRRVGSGHIMRCKTLADSLASIGWHCGFAVGSGSTDLVPALAESSHETFTIACDVADEAEILSRRWPNGVDWLIIDHYQRDRLFEAACRPWARKIMVLDDLADRPHDCDLLLDQTLDRKAENYAEWSTPDCRLLLGTGYALLRPEFRAIRKDHPRPASPIQRQLRVLITLGGTDPDNVTETCLDALQQSGISAEVDVVAGQGFASLDRLRKRCESLEGFRLHVSPHNMGELMAEADLSIGAAGTTSWERCCLGLPTIMLVLADNQQENARQLSAAGAVKVIDGANPDTARGIAEALQELDEDRASLHEMSNKAAALCDGQGSLRAILALLPEQPTRDGIGVQLRLAEAKDEAILLYWQQQPSIRALARNPAVPTEAEHRAWFSSRLRSENCFITLIEHGRDVAGMLRLDRLDTSDRQGVFEVSIVVDDRHRGVGVGLAALRQIRVWMPDVEFRAETLPDNHPSIALFRSAGYRPFKDNLLHSTAA